MPERTPEDAAFVRKLREDLYGIHYRWKATLEVCQMSGEQLRLAHSFGPDFFHFIQRALADEITISLARFTDVDKPGEHRVVTLQAAIVRFLGAAELTAARKRLGAVWVKIKDVRDRMLAHSDYDLHVPATPSKPFVGVTFGEMKFFVAEVTAIMKEVDHAYDGQDIRYDDPVRRGSWEAVFEGLREAEIFRQLQDRARSGLAISAQDLLGPSGSDDPDGTAR